MKTRLKKIAAAAVLVFTSFSLTQCANGPVTKMNAAHASAGKISSDSRVAQDDLYAKDPAARRLGAKAAGVLVFPSVLKGGLVFGAEGGNGALISNGHVTHYCQTAAASYGLQAGMQEFGYALFLMSPGDVRNLDSAAGWEVGSNPTLVVLDRGKATALTTKTMEKGVYAYFFNQKRLMAGSV